MHLILYYIYRTWLYIWVTRRRRSRRCLHLASTRANTRVGFAFRFLCCVFVLFAYSCLTGNFDMKFIKTDRWYWLYSAIVVFIYIKQKFLFCTGVILLCHLYCCFFVWSADACKMISFLTFVGGLFLGWTKTLMWVVAICLLPCLGSDVTPGFNWFSCTFKMSSNWFCFLYHTGLALTDCKWSYQCH